MIWIFLATWISGFFDTIFDVLKIPVITQLPFGVDALLSTFVGWINQATVYIPILSAPYKGFLWFIQGLLVYYIGRVFRIWK